MKRLLLDKDIHPLSEFRANVALFVQQVRKTHRPVVITQHGKSAAVLLNVSDYETLLDKLETIEEVRQAEEQIGRGEGISHEAAKTRLLEKFKK